jgi:pimeloyl-ACP methyl ester carboxylesterase
MSLSFDAWRSSGARFSFRGHSLFYQHTTGTGTGPALLLVHGLPTASWDYHRVWSALKQRASALIAPDMLGFGWSDKPAGHTYSIAEQADLHEALLRAHGIGHYRMIAHDYGATVAQELLARHHERTAAGDTSLMLSGVCLLNAGLFPETHRPLLIQRLMLTPLGPLLSRGLNFRSFEKSFSSVFGPRTRPTRDELREFWQLLTHADGKRHFYRLFHYIPERRLQRERWVGALVKSTVPLRLINGPADPVSGAHMAERYRALVPHPKIVSLPGVGHYPHLEDPEGVLRGLAPLLD